MSTALNLLLAFAVAAAWLGCLGFWRLRTPSDKIHCITFVNAACGIAILGASLMQDGVSDRVLKILLIVLVNLVSGAGISHATGRAIIWRNKTP